MIVEIFVKEEIKIENKNNINKELVILVFCVSGVISSMFVNVIIKGVK